MSERVQELSKYMKDADKIGIDAVSPEAYAKILASAKAKYNEDAKARFDAIKAASQKKQMTTHVEKEEPEQATIAFPEPERPLVSVSPESEDPITHLFGRPGSLKDYEKHDETLEQKMQNDPRFTPNPREHKAKILFYDCETTGVKFWRNGVHQISGYIDICGGVAEKFNLEFRPVQGVDVDPEALTVSNLTVDQVMARPMVAAAAYAQFIKMIEKYVDRFNKQDKIFLCGYNNAGFDDNFLRGFFKQHGNDFFGAYFWADPLDVRVLAADLLRDSRPKMVDFKLKTVAKYMGIKVDESKLHDAMYDIEITRELYYLIQEKKCR